MQHLSSQALLPTGRQRSKTPHRGKVTMALGKQTYGFFIPTVSLMGIGSAEETGAQVKALGASKALLVTDKGISAMGMADQVKAQVEAAGVQVVIFDGAEPNPTDINVHDGVKVYQEQGCDAIISLG